MMGPRPANAAAGCLPPRLYDGGIARARGRRRAPDCMGHLWQRPSQAPGPSSPGHPTTPPTPSLAQLALGLKPLAWQEGAELVTLQALMQLACDGCGPE